ncbi:hypothetical protein Bbelb_043700 [Branchiostoma belcheri]|nr:hypothetical protein Bbelb_043700 [Branchiostoma belcheri]
MQSLAQELAISQHSTAHSKITKGFSNNSPRSHLGSGQVATKEKTQGAAEDKSQVVTQKFLRGPLKNRPGSRPSISESRPGLCQGAAPHMVMPGSRTGIGQGAVQE